ncbi:MAG: type IV toxin-antitoxin system AbiEi family antitoxin domain-containing protein [Acidimicrobiales bacterium]
MPEDPTPDQLADDVAARQHGAINRRQALEVGLTRHQIAARVASGRWRRAAGGVYVVTAVAETWQQGVMVACLAGPEGTAASHLTAAALLGLVEPPDLPHVTVGRRANHRLSGAIVHRVSHVLDSGDLCTVEGILSTSAARTLVDCAGELDYGSFCELLDTMLIRRLATSREVRAAADRASTGPGRKGLPLIDQALEVWSSGRRPDSPPEIKLHRLLLQWGFPAPVRQHPIFDANGRFVAKVDLAIPAWKVALEYDGQEYHGPRQKQADTARQARIEAVGWVVVRVTKYDLRRPSRLRVRLQAVVDSRAA